MARKSESDENGHGNGKWDGVSVASFSEMYRRIDREARRCGDEAREEPKVTKNGGDTETRRGGKGCATKERNDRTKTGDICRVVRPKRKR